MDIIKKAKNLIGSFRSLKKHIFPNFSLRDKTIWLRRINFHVKSCNNLVREGNISVPIQRNLQTTILQLKTLKLFIQNIHIQHHGSGINLPPSINRRVVWRNVNSCFQSRITTGAIINLVHKDVQKFFQDSFILFKRKINLILKRFSLIKVNTTFCGEFVKQECVELKYFNTKNAIIDLSTDLHAWFFENVCDKIFNKLSEFEEGKSGFALQKIIYLEVNINKYEMGTGGSSYIKLPHEILAKRACINIKNNDQACFYWSIMGALFPNKNNPRFTSSYPHYKSALITDNLQAPMALNRISKFEKSNQISVNVYALELIKHDKNSFFSVIPARLTENKLSKHVNLLLIQDKYFPKLNDFDAQPIEVSEGEDSLNINYHYCLIKNLSRLVSRHLNNKKNKKFICDRCLNYFSSLEKLNMHEELCVKLNDCKMSFPKYQYVQFKNHTYKQKNPFVIYADFECLLAPVDYNVGVATKKYQKHIAYSAGYYLKCSYDNTLSYFKSYRGLDCMDWFINELTLLSDDIYSKFKDIKQILNSPDLSNATHCHICSELFKPSDKIVRDHDHFTGLFRGFAHQICNLNFRKSFIVPVVFHNLSGYDSHFIIKGLAKKGYVNVLPSNKEKYISFTYYKQWENCIRFRFIDSFRFIGASLDTLMSSMEKKDFSILRSEFSTLDDKQFELLTRKGVFCYDYIDNLEKLEETALPPINAFYNKLEDSNISEQNYLHAQTVWNSFEIQDLGQYSDLYLKTDILGLADVFENFRSNCIASHKLDVAWYHSMPGYAWDCMLQLTNCKLELLHDIDQIMFIEQGIRGGLSVCVNRYSEANNKYLPNFDSSKPSNYILYLDINNLYGRAMVEPLPYGGFEWVDDITNFDVMSVLDSSPIGYILEVDLDYPESLHDYHKDFPFCPEHRVPPHSKFKKLMGTLHHKKRYILHYRNLKQALDNGLILKKIHKILKFNQSPWLKPYIELNNRLRTRATSTFLKNLFKLFNNAVFGKFIENIRNRRIVKFVRSWYGRHGAKNLIANPRFHSRVVLDEELSIIELKKAELIFNKPLYIGMAVLDISKLFMYNFHYDFMLPKMGVERCKLMYTDTDSFIYDLKCDDAYIEIIKSNLDKFDTSDYPLTNPYNIPRVNKKILGLQKDEVNGNIITHFVGLRSKMYSYKVQGGNICKKAKGIKYGIVRNKLSFEDYIQCLKNCKIIDVTQRSIRSYSHNVFSIEQTKIALSPHDDKRYIQQGTFDTLPFGHYSLS